MIRCLVIRPHRMAAGHASAKMTKHEWRITKQIRIRQ
jgi:hypothetical protein